MTEYVRILSLSLSLCAKHGFAKFARCCLYRIDLAVRSYEEHKYPRMNSGKFHRMGTQLSHTQCQLFARILGRKGQRYAGMG